MALVVSFLVAGPRACCLRKGIRLLNDLNLFAHLQTRTSRAQELYEKRVGGTMPDLTVKSVYR